jgi:hypothetical protein
MGKSSGVFKIIFFKAHPPALRAAPFKGGKTSKNQKQSLFNL